MLVAVDGVEAVLACLSLLLVKSGLGEFEELKKLGLGVAGVELFVFLSDDERERLVMALSTHSEVKERQSQTEVLLKVLI